MACLPAIEEGQGLAVAQVWQGAISSPLPDRGVVPQLPVVEEGCWEGADGRVHAILL